MKKTHVVLGGGGVYGIAILGAMSSIYSTITHFSGTSAGALVAVALCLYTPEELLKELKTFKFFPDESIDLTNFIEHYGFIDVQFLLTKIAYLLHKKIGIDSPTLLELHTFSKKTVYICGTNISQQSTEYFSFESHPDMKVIDALHITMSIPLLMKKVEYNGELYVDGGVTDNFPIKPFLKTPYKYIIGIKVFYNQHCNDPSLYEYIAMILCTMLHKPVPNDIKTIEIPIKDVNLTKNLTLNEITQLYNFGKECYEASMCSTAS